LAAASAATQTVIEVKTQASLVDWLQLAVTAIGAIVVTALVAAMPFLRRPKLTIEEDAEHVHSHLERSQAGELPHVRLLVANSKWRRAASGTRVLVEGYTEQGAGGIATALGHPSLGWPSGGPGEEAALTVFPDARRPITLGYFIRAPRDAKGKLRRPREINTDTGQEVRYLPHFATDDDYARVAGPRAAPMNGAWFLRLALAFELDIFDDRDKLAPVKSGYAIRLLVGADDGAARPFEVHINWESDANLSAKEVLRSALDHLHVHEV
jgi:hypothetical protein